MRGSFFHVYDNAIIIILCVPPLIVVYFFLGGGIAVQGTAETTPARG